MGKFSIITGSGHCGSLWLATMLGSQKDVTWHHHLSYTATNLQWQVADLLSPADKAYDVYWNQIEHELRSGDVGDANSWPPHLLLNVNIVYPIDHVIYMTRNGVSQLYSIMRSSVLRRQTLPKGAEVKLRSLYDIMPDKPEEPYGEWSRFKKLCLMIAANKFMPDYLRTGGLKVSDYSLDNLILDAKLVKKIAPKLTLKNIKELQKVDLNRKVPGERSPEKIWAAWSEEQRAAYMEIVG